MDTVTRRKFLTMTAGAVAAGALAPILSEDEIASAAITRPLAAGTPILVMVTLYGGNDGLNTVIPYTDSIYFASRPDISYKADQVLPLDAELATSFRCRTCTKSCNERFKSFMGSKKGSHCSRSWISQSGSLSFFINGQMADCFAGAPHPYRLVGALDRFTK